MHPFAIPEAIAARAAVRCGAVHPFVRLRARGRDTVLVAVPATEVRCGSSASDAVTLDFRTAMASDDPFIAVADAEHAASPVAFRLRQGGALPVSERVAGSGAGARAA